MKQINIFADGHTQTVTIEKDAPVSFTWLPQGKETLKGKEIHVGDAKLENEEGGTISVTASILGGLFHNKLVTRHYPILKKLHGRKDTYKVHPNVIGLDFSNGR